MTSFPTNLRISQGTSPEKIFTSNFGTIESNNKYIILRETKNTITPWSFYFPNNNLFFLLETNNTIAPWSFYFPNNLTQAHEIIKMPDGVHTGQLKFFILQFFFESIISHLVIQFRRKTFYLTSNMTYPLVFVTRKSTWHIPTNKRNSQGAQMLRCGSYSPLQHHWKKIQLSVQPRQASLRQMTNPKVKSSPHLVHIFLFSQPHLSKANR